MNYTKHILPNGLRLLLAPLHETDAVTVLSMTKVGSRYETSRNNGVSHFLEHMVFKGTEKRPTAQDVAKELDGVGASFNAFTSKDYTGYYIKLSREHLPLALDIIADMLWHSKFLQEEIDKERKVIMEEINMYFDNPVMLLDDLFEQRMFGKRHPLGRFISGPKSVIAKLQRDDIVTYFRRHYFPSNMVMSVAGNFAETKTLAMITKLFGIVEHRRAPTVFRRFLPYQHQPQVDMLFRKTEQVQLGFGFPALSYRHKDLPALGLLSIILGGNMSSRLFTRIREREGLAYAIHATRSSYQDTGVFSIQAGLDKTRLMPALDHILDELRLVQRHGVTREELSRAKEFIKGKLILELEDSEQIASFLTRQELLTGVIQTPKERFAELQKVTRADIQRVARAVFRPSRANLALIGPFRDPQPFLKVLGRR